MRLAGNLVAGDELEDEIGGTAGDLPHAPAHVHAELLLQFVRIVLEPRDDLPAIASGSAPAGLRRPLADEEIVLLDEWHAGTYGIPDAKTIEAIRLCARLEGMLTDPVYEGKSMAALIDLVRDGRIEPGSKVLYAHLGGQPALNGYARAFA